MGEGTSRKASTVSVWRLSSLGPCGNRSSTSRWLSSKSCVTEIRICAQRSLNFQTLSSPRLPAMLNIKGQERHIHSAILEQDQSSGTHAGPAAAQLCCLNTQKGERAATRFPNGSCPGSLRGQPQDKRELGSKRKKKVILKSTIFNDTVEVQDSAKKQ